MALDDTTTPGIGAIIKGLAAASFVSAGIMLTATIITGLQFADTGGVPDVGSVIMFLLLYVFFATPIMALIVFPLGSLVWLALSKVNLLKLWAFILAGLIIGYGLSWLIPFLPDLILMSQLPSPIREIASIAGGGSASVVFWLISRPNRILD